MSAKIVLTVEGLKKLEDELRYLKTEKRNEIAEKIKEARDFGDLSENSEYDAAQNELAISEARIRDIEEQLKNVTIIDANELTTDHIGVGTAVLLLDCEFPEDEPIKYTIVSRTESNPSEYKISDQSPMGMALIGKKKGDVVTVKGVKYRITNAKKKTAEAYAPQKKTAKQQSKAKHDRAVPLREASNKNRELPQSPALLHLPTPSF